MNLCCFSGGQTVILQNSMAAVFFLVRSGQVGWLVGRLIGWLVRGSPTLVAMMYYF
jgi:hypothetical protein